MISLIEPTYETNLKVSPIVPIYKTGVRKQPNQKGDVKDRKPKVLFKDTLDKAISMGLGTKISVRV